MNSAQESNAPFARLHARDLLRRSQTTDNRAIRRIITILAYAYVAALVLVVIVLRYGSQSLWQADLALYLPRVLFGLPLPIFVVLLLALRSWRALWSQLAAAIIVMFPLMGLVVPSLPRAPLDPDKAITVFSYNGNFAYGGQDALAQEVRRFKPDIAVFQQLVNTDKLDPALASDYSERRTDGEFFIASKFKIDSAEIPGRLLYRGAQRSPRFIRYALETSIGPLVVYSVHPISPRYQINAARSGGLRNAIMSGALFSLQSRADTESDTGLRTLQVLTFSRMAAREPYPVIVAGDTNLPQLSPGLSYLDAFRDGFAEVGSGFGYTFPGNQPWMRIDRIFASRQLEFLKFAVGQSRASDHLPVFAQLQPTVTPQR